MHGIFHFDEVKMSGSFSFELTDIEGVTSEAVVAAIKTGMASFKQMSDGAAITVNSEVVAKICRVLPTFDFTDSKTSFEKNEQLPYFYGFDGIEDVKNIFDDEEFFDEKEILLAAQHVDSHGYGTVFVIVKTSKNKLAYCLFEDTLRGRDSNPKWLCEDMFITYRSENDSERDFHGNVPSNREYYSVVKKILDKYC